MLNLFLSHIRPSQPVRQIKAWQYFIATMSARIRLYRNRFISSAYIDTKLTRFLEALLDKIPVSYINNGFSDFEKYLDLAGYLNGDVTNLFDPELAVRHIERTFCKEPTKEIIVSVEHREPLTDLPLDKPFRYWREIRPVRVIHYPSLELFNSFDSYQLSFEKVPEYFVATVDPMAMAFMYARYVQYLEDENEQLLAKKAFIKYFLLPGIFDDAMRIWITNILISMCSADFDPRQISIGPVFSISSSNVEKAIRNINEVYASNNVHNTPIGSLLSFEWFGSYSLIDVMNEIDQTCSVPERTDHYHLDFIISVPYVLLLAKYFHMIGKSQLKNEFKLFRKYVSRMERRKTSMRIRDPRYRELYTSLVEQVTREIDTLPL